MEYSYNEMLGSDNGITYTEKEYKSMKKAAEKAKWDEERKALGGESHRYIRTNTIKGTRDELAHKLTEKLPHGVHAGVAGLHVVNAVKDSYFVPSEKAECLDLIDGIPLCYEREQVAQLLLSQFFPPCGKFEVDSLRVFVHNKSG